MFALATLIMWLKTMYFLRIFRSVGYLTSMIIQVGKDMKSFFIILLMSIVMFGNTFYILSLNNPPSDQFITSFIGSISWTY